MFYVRVVFFYLMTTATLAAPATFYAYQSQAGDYIGDGKSAILSDGDSKITAGGTHADLILSAGNHSESWHMLISAPQGSSLTDQIYNHTTAWGSTVDPQLLVGVDKRGCSIAQGSFDVKEIQFGAGGLIEHLAIDFMQHCNDSKAALFGAIRYHSTVPNDLAQYILAHTTQTDIQLYSQAGDRIGEGKTYQFSKSDKDYNINTSGHNNHLSIEYNPSGYWNFDFAASDKNPLTEGYYPNASRYTRAVLTNALYAHTSQRVCNSVMGRFDVLEFDAQQKRYAIDFEQQCDGAQPALYGAIRIHSNKPISIVAKAHYDAASKILTLPMVEMDQGYYAMTLAVIQDHPALFKVTSISPSSVARDEIKVPQVFDADQKLLTVPIIESTDVFGHRYDITKISLVAPNARIFVGDDLTIKIENHPNSW